MKSQVFDALPSSVRRSLTKFGGDLAIARRKRSLTVAMMAERVGVSRGTYIRVEKGDATVAMGVYAMALFALGFGNVFAELVDSSADERGLLLDEARLPKRVRVKREPRAT
jgi:DNA-binding XRE family transcriptional regulator